MECQRQDDYTNHVNVYSGDVDEGIKISVIRFGEWYEI
jgi:hypothetical protein